MPEISIIVPVYQVEKYIDNCISSIVRQSYGDYELILINDGTKDQSIVIAEQILKKTNIDYLIVTKDNYGQAAARNDGVRIAKGKWIVFVDADDILSKDFLSTLHDAVDKYNVDVAAANLRIIDEGSSPDEPLLIEEPFLIKQDDLFNLFLVRRLNIVVSCMIIRKESFIHNNLWFDESIRFGEDAHFYWRLIISQDQIAYNNTPIYNYLIHCGSTTTSPSIGKMLSNYNAFTALHQSIELKTSKQKADFVIARQCFSMLRVFAVYNSYREFLKLYSMLNFNDSRRVLLRFPDFRVRLLCLSMYFSKRVFYVLNHRRLIV